MAFIILGGTIGWWSMPYHRWALARRYADSRLEVYQEAFRRCLLGIFVAFAIWKTFIRPDPPNPDAGDPYWSYRGGSRVHPEQRV